MIGKPFKSSLEGIYGWIILCLEAMDRVLENMAESMQYKSNIKHSKGCSFKISKTVGRALDVNDFLRYHTYEIYVDKLRLYVTMRVARNPIWEWRCKLVKHFYLSNPTTNSSASTLNSHSPLFYYISLIKYNLLRFACLTYSFETPCVEFNMHPIYFSIIA